MTTSPSKIPTIGINSTGNSWAFNCCVDNSDSEHEPPQLKETLIPVKTKTLEKIEENYDEQHKPQ